MRCFILSVLMFCSAFANADDWQLHLEQGQATTLMATPNGFAAASYSAVSLDYSYLNIIGGGWQGENHRANFLGVGATVRSNKQYYIEAGMGMIKLFNAHTSRLDGNYQLSMVLGVGADLGGLVFSIKYRHFSNADTVEPNLGADFKIVSIGAVF